MKFFHADKKLKQTYILYSQDDIFGEIKIY
jgi:hypothetical protein